MTDDHCFVDSAGSTVEGKEACTAAWRKFFGSFPDYRNVFDEIRLGEDGLVQVRGRSNCSVSELDGPACWQAAVRDGLIAEWRVLPDAPPALS